MAGRGIGVTVICPFPLLAPGDPSLAIRPFRPEFVYRTSFVVSAVRPLSQPVRAFMRHVQLAVRSPAYAVWHQAESPPPDGAPPMEP